VSVRLDRARAYLKSLESGAAVEDFFTADIVQEEFPNRLNPNGGRSDLAQMKARAEQGKDIVRWQLYDVINTFESGATVILEVNLSAAFNVAIGALQPGDIMKARFAVFLDFEGDRIRRQRNYDCFDPF